MAIPASTGLSYLRQEYREPLWVLMAIVAIRLAIGVGRARLIRQLMTESLLLSVVAAGFGVLFAQGGSR